MCGDGLLRPSHLRASYNLAVRVLIWHGWLLEGSGSNIYAARTAEVLRRAGHEVLLLCQEQHPDRLKFVDGFGWEPQPFEPALKTYASQL